MLCRHCARAVRGVPIVEAIVGFDDRWHLNAPAPVAEGALLLDAYTGHLAVVAASHQNEPISRLPGEDVVAIARRRIPVWCSSIGTPCHAHSWGQTKELGVRLRTGGLSGDDAGQEDFDARKELLAVVVLAQLGGHLAHKRVWIMLGHPLCE